MFSRIDKTEILIFVVTLLVSLVTFCLGLSYAQLPSDVENTSISISLNQIVDDTNVAALIAVPYDIDLFDGYIAGIGQSGNLIRGKYHAEAGVDIGEFRAVLYTDGTFKGYSTDNIGRQSDYGLAIDTPKISGANVRVGIFGRNAGEFGPPNARDILENNGFDPNDLDGRDLESLTPPPAGLSFQRGSSLNALIQTAFTYRGVSVKVAGMPELTGEGSPAHQGIISGFVNKNVTEHISLDLGAELGFQWWNDTVEREAAYFVGIGLDF